MPHLLLPMPHLLPQLPPTRHLTLLPQLHLLPDLDQLLTWMLSPLLEPLANTNLPGPLRQLPELPDTCPTFNLLLPPHLLHPTPHLLPKLPPPHHLTQLHLLPDLDHPLTWMLSPLLEPLASTNLPSPLRQLVELPDTWPTFNLLLPLHQVSLVPPQFLPSLPLLLPQLLPTDLDHLLTWMLSPLLEPLANTNLPSPCWNHR